MKKGLAILLILCLLPVCALAENTDDIIIEMIADYAYYGDAGVGSIEVLLSELTEADPELGAIWRYLMYYWININRATPNYNNLPEGLDDTDGLCLVVLGYQLEKDGAVRPELEERLKTALTCARQYPNAYVLCTGGGTARNNPDVTEADAMADWLIEHGVDEGRIIRENQSRTTTQNALYSCAILRESYPQVQSVAIITTDYHIPDGATMFEAEGLLGANGKKQIHVAAHAACLYPDHKEHGFEYQTQGLLAIAGLLDKAEDWREAHPGKPALRG